MYTCLFTDEPLPESNAEEHAPPRALGGRFFTPRAVATSLNSRFGSTIDRALIENWVRVLVEIQPLLPKRYRCQDTLRFSHDGLSFEYGAGGVVRLARPEVERDQAGGLTRALVGDMAQGHKMAKALRRGGREVELVRTLGFNPESVPGYRGALLSVEGDLAALKACLVVFDMLKEPWVRSSLTARAREFVVAAANGAELEPNNLAGVLWGHHPEPRVGGLREYCDQFGVTLPEYGHTFFASHDPPTGILLVGLCLFGVETVTFRFEGKAGFEGTVLVGCDPLGNPVRWPEVRLGSPFRVTRGVSAVGTFEDRTKFARDAHTLSVNRTMAAGALHIEAMKRVPLRERAQLHENYAMGLHHSPEGAPTSTRALLLRRLVPLWSTSRVMQAMDALGVEDAEISVPDQVAQGARLPDWAFSGAESYADLCAYLSSRFGPPTIHVGQGIELV